MPARKSTLRVTVEAGGKRFSLNCESISRGRYRVKVGRSVSVKHPWLTTSEIFEKARSWAVRQEAGR